ncbi:MAG TPA: hypothetical protein VNJ71_10450 [Gemmatimonadales bacterium]|nr:hypothetical protein [Gemmatimonadales bacterium]
MKPAGNDPGATLSPVQTLALLLEHRRLIASLPLLLASLVGMVGLLLPRTYTSRATFVPQSEGSALSRVAGLAAQFGFVLPAGEGEPSADFYAELLKSEGFLRLVIDTPVTVRHNGREVSINLRDFFGRGEQDTLVRRARAIEELGKRVRVSTGIKTGVVEVGVRTRDAGLSAVIAARLLEELNRFNLQTRQSRAREERRFLEGRLAEARDSLRAAEDRLQAFLQRNREFKGSPQLGFEHDRLQRAVTERQEVVTTLAQAFERSRIDEVRNTPVITVLQAPELPVRPDRRWLAAKVLVAGVAGLLLATLLVVWQARLASHVQSAPDEWARVRSLVLALRGDLKRPWRLERGRGGERVAGVRE